MFAMDGCDFYDSSEAKEVNQSVLCENRTLHTDAGTSHLLGVTMETSRCVCVFTGQLRWNM